jgi:NADP-dependent 3-hydroxy acid dehydrogenase YdfG
MPAPRPTPLAGQTVMITGAGSGIGRALAQRLSGLGCPVAVADIDEAGLTETAASLSGPVLPVVLDVRDAQAQLAFAKSVREWMPRPLGAVFNNAGVALSSTVLAAVPEDDDWLHDINFRGVVNGVRAFLPILVEQDHGAIVNTSSVFGLAGIPTQSAYCSAKFAVRGFTESLRHELRGTGVRAVTVHPGGVDTNIVRNGRMRADPQGRTAEARARDFAASAMTTPARAAEVIQQGVDRGRARILVGPDAQLFDALSRLAPTRYLDILLRLGPVLRAARRRTAGRATR